MIPTDAELLRRYVVDRAEEAFAELVRRHLNLVYFAALRQLGDDPAAAQDVAQSVFIDLARKARSLSHREVLASWLYTSTRFAATKARRARARRQKNETEAEIMRTQDGNPESATQWESLRPLIDEVVHELAEPDRAAVLLRFFEQRPFTEIGVALRISEDAARMRVERALERLRVSLARRGVVSTSAALGTVLGCHAVPAAPVGLAAALANTALVAGSAAVATPGFTLLHFMSQTKIIGAAAAIAFLTLSTATWQVTERQAAEAAMARSQESLAATISDLKKLEAHANLADQANSAASARSPSVSSPEGRGGQPSASPFAASIAKPAPRTAVRLADEMMARHPEVKQAILDWQIKMVNFEYGPLYDELKLTPAQIARFGELLRGDGLFGDWGANGVFLQFQLPKDVSHGQEDDAVRELLGPEGWRKYQDFSSTVWARQTVAQMASQASMLDVALTPEQARSLVTNLARIPQPNGDSLDVEYWRKVISKAGELALSPEQLAILETIAAADMRSTGMIELWKAEAPKAAVAR